MKKITLKITTFLFFILIAGCSQLKNMASEYALNESTIDKYIQRYLGETKRFDAAGLANATLAFNNMNVDIGREDPNKVTLSGNAKFGLSSILGAQSADMMLKIKARPVYDGNKGAVYLKELELNDYELTSSLGSVANTALLPYLNKALQFYFDEQPLYTLSAENSPVEAVVLKLVKNNIEVEQGRLVFPLANK